MQIEIERSLTGWLILSTLHNGYLVTRKYQGYTTKEARQLFTAELKEGRA